MTKKINLSGLILDSPVMVGAGPIKLPKHVLEIAKSEASAIVIGSISVKERLGNPEPSYYSNLKTRLSLNSRGLPNPGLEYYKKNLPEMVKIAHEYGKPLIVNIVGFSPEDYMVLSSLVLKSGADGQEINLGCPNAWDKDGKQKRIPSFSEELTSEILEKVKNVTGSKLWTTAKLSPIPDSYFLEKIANILSSFNFIKAVTTTNSMPNCLALDERYDPVVSQSEGLSGMTGDFLKPIGLGQVKMLKKILTKRISIIGVGGISTNKDLNDYLKVGATAVQVTTGYVNFGIKIFKKVKG